MATVDVEIQEEKPTVDVETASESVGVGVLGWLGFIIVNLAAWGIIGVATAFGWIVGLCVCLLCLR